MTKNLRNRRPSKKLNYIKVGPFLINKKKKMPKGQPWDNYQLKLPLNIGIYPVFNISLLKPADPVILI